MPGSVDSSSRSVGAEWVCDELNRIWLRASFVFS